MARPTLYKSFTQMLQFNLNPYIFQHMYASLSLQVQGHAQETFKGQNLDDHAFNSKVKTMINFPLTYLSRSMYLYAFHQ